MDTRILDMERLFKALGDGTRLRILGLLLAGEVCVCHIHDSLRIRSPRRPGIWRICGAPGSWRPAAMACGCITGWRRRAIR